MTEWLRDGLEGRSLKATLRLYLLGLMVLAPAAALLAVAFGGQVSFVATPLLVFVLVAVEYAVSYRPKLRKDLEELHWDARVVLDNSAALNVNVLQGQYVSDASVRVRPLESIVESLVHDNDGSVRAAAASGLGSIGDHRAVDPLIGALKDRDPSVRDAAALALMKIGDLRAVEALASALRDEDASVRSSAAEALWRISSMPAAQTVIPSEVMETVRRMRTIDRSDGTPLKGKSVSTPDEPIRKRA